MTIQTTEWRPDHCNCIIQYTWDDSVPSDQRIHRVKTTIPCKHHEHLANHEIIHDTVTNENRLKNWGLKHILDNSPTPHLFELVDNGGSRTLKSGLELKWSYSGIAPNRTVSLSVNGISLTDDHRKTIQSKLDSKFGVGKVLIS